MEDLLVILSGLFLLAYLLRSHRRQQAWQARYDAVEQRAIELSRARDEGIPLY